MFGCGGEPKILISGTFTYFFKEFVNFSKFCEKFLAVVFYSNISMWESRPTTNIFLKTSKLGRMF